MLNEHKHPMQPIDFDEHGVIRFKQNAIIAWLFETGKLNLNEIAIMTSRGMFPVEDEVQIAQLLGYSVSGFGDLSYVPSEVVAEADAQADKLSNSKKAFASGTNAEDDCG